MTIELDLPELTDMRPRITVIGVGGAGGNAINNMIASGLEDVQFVAANTDAQALAMSSADRRLQLGVKLTEGLGAGARPEIGQAAAEEAIEEIRAELDGSHMVFIAAGMGGGTGTGAASVIARVARELGILTVAIVSKPFHFEGSRRMRVADAGVKALRRDVDTLIVIPNQNLFRIATDQTTFAESFVLADQVLYSGVACIVDLVMKDGLINLDFADVRSVMVDMGTAVMGTGEAEGEQRATLAAEEALANPLLDDIRLDAAQGVLVSIVGGPDMTLFEVDEAANRIRSEVNSEANIIVGATFDTELNERFRVSLVAAGMDRQARAATPTELAEAVSAEPARPAPGEAVSPVPPPLPHSQFVRQASSGDSPEKSHETDFARALNGDAATESEPGANGSEKPKWQSSDGVTVEPEETPSADRADDPSVSPARAHHESVQAVPKPATFEPASPVESRTSTPRFPGPEQFPPHAQKLISETKAVPAPDDAKVSRPRSGGLFRKLQGLALRGESVGRESPSDAAEGRSGRGPDKKVS